MTRSLLAILVWAALAGACTDGRGIILGDAPDPDAPDSDADAEPADDPAPDPVIPDDPPPDVPDIVEEPAWPCTPEFSDQRRTIFGGLAVSVGAEGDPDRPDLLTLSNGQVWVMGRIVSSPSATDTPKLTYVTVNPINALPGGSWYHPLGEVELDAYHPTVPLGDPDLDPTLAMLTVFPDVHGIASNELMFMRLGTPPAAGPPVPLTGTDILSTQPAAASNGDEAMVLWRQGDDTGMGSSINYGIVDAGGMVLSTGHVAGTGGAPLSNPAITHAGDRYGVAWFNDETPRLEMAWISEDGEGGETITYSGMEPGTTGGIGRPAVAWDGSHFDMAFELVGSYGVELGLCSWDLAGSSRICSALNDVLEPVVGTITTEQRGMLDMVWNGRRFGVVWVHVDMMASRNRVWFFELDTGGAIVNGPHLLNPDSTDSYHPSITWVESGPLYYYVFAWVEYSPASGFHVLYTYTYGCER